MSALFINSARGEINIAPYSNIHSIPYIGADLRYLVDGKIGNVDDNTYMLSAPMSVRSAHSHLLQVNFSFPKKFELTRIRLFQHESAGNRRLATGYVIELDTSGDAQYDTIAVSESKGIGEKWIEYVLHETISAYGLRFRATNLAKANGPNYGGPILSEIEIYVNGGGNPSQSIPIDSALYPELMLVGGERLTSKINELPAIGGPQYSRGIFGSMWLYWKAGDSYKKKNNSRNISNLNKLNVNRYWLYPGVYVNPGDRNSLVKYPDDPNNRYYVERKARAEKKIKILPFPSSVAAGYETNILREMVNEFNKNGIDVIANELPLPYGLEGWDYPRVAKPKTYPCILSSRFAWDSSTRLYQEFMDAGVNGLVLGGDEFFFHGHDGDHEVESAICKDEAGRSNGQCEPTCRQLFAQQYGYKDYRVAKGVFSPSLAKWKVFEYEQLAKLFFKHADMMRSVEPDSIVTSLLRPQEGNRVGYGVAYDIMGFQGGVEELSSNPYWSHNNYLGHYYFANEAKKLIGASRKRKAHITLQATPRFNSTGYENPMMVYGPAFSALMHGVRGVSFYKQDYLFAGGKHDATPWVSKFFNLTLYLERLGLLSCSPPKSVALLYSRASEDWWQLSNSKNGLVASEALLQQNAVMEVLFRNAVPFDLYYLDQPESLTNLKNYRAVILPYPYSISMESLRALEHAREAGAKFIALTQLGAVNQYAEPYDKPPLREIVNERFFDININQLSYEALSGIVMTALNEALGGAFPLFFDAHGYDVECSVATQKNQSHLVFCLNWEREAVAFDLGLDLADGMYDVSFVNLDMVGSVEIGGDKNMTPELLSKFSMRLMPGEARVLSIMRKPDEVSH